ncbi:sigma-70 family RNA polymerase sigma factor [soil metagenome]
MVDELVVQRALRGERIALEELCQAEWRPIYGLIYHTVQNRTEAQDLTQEVFLRALRLLDRYQVTESPFHAYLTTIARNLLRDRWRRRKLSTIPLIDAFDIGSNTPGPEPLALATIEREVLERAFRTLPDDYQTVIRLRILEERSSPETGELMGRSPDAVRQLQRRALGALRQALEQSVTA